MIIVSLTGGLGNQMFQYALGRSLAIRHQTELLLDTQGYGPNGEARPAQLRDFVRPLRIFSFNVKARSATAAEISLLRDDFHSANVRDRLVRQVRRLWPGFLWKASHVRERGFHFQHGVLDAPDNTFLSGYWQSPLYFEQVETVIRQDFQLRDRELASSAKAYVQNLRAAHGSVVSVHVRRGDLARASENPKHRSLAYGAPVGVDYIRSAMQHFGPQGCFFVFSDSPADLGWCREHLPNDYGHLHFSDATSDLWDFAAMMSCDHHVIANSTFSWWAAWLNPSSTKKVICPERWSWPELSSQMPLNDLIPKNWIVLP